jgi:hypothetical protein
MEPSRGGLSAQGLAPTAGEKCWSLKIVSKLRPEPRYQRIFGFTKGFSDVPKISEFLFFKIFFLHEKNNIFCSDFLYHQSLGISFPTHLARASGSVSA